MTDFIDIGRHIRHGDATLLSADALSIIGRVLTRHASRKDRQRLGTDILAELEILEEAQTTRLVIVPDVEIRHATLERTHRMVPVIDVFQALTMTHTATREAHELGMQVGNDLRQILSQAVLTAHKGFLWEKRHHIDTYVSCFLGDDDQTRLFIARLSLEHR